MKAFLLLGALLSTWAPQARAQGVPTGEPNAILNLLGKDSDDASGSFIKLTVRFMKDGNDRYKLMKIELCPAKARLQSAPCSTLKIRQGRDSQEWFRTREFTALRDRFCDGKPETVAICGKLEKNAPIFAGMFKVLKPAGLKAAILSKIGDSLWPAKLSDCDQPAPGCTNVSVKQMNLGPVVANLREFSKLGDSRYEDESAENQISNDAH